MNKNKPGILFEYCEKNLEDIIQCEKLSNEKTVFIIYQIAEGMRFAHSKKIIHRNLKPTNILFTEKTNEFTVKITDFGTPDLLSIEEQLSSCISISQKFMAPELFDEEKNYTEKVDVYSFGVLVYYILSEGKLPKIKLLDFLSGKKPQIPSNFTPLAKELINACWSFQPENRPSFIDILDLIDKYL